jgi:hypothetical protein
VSTFDALANDYTTGKAIRLSGKRVRQLVTLLAELALHTDEHDDHCLGRRTRALLQTLAPRRSPSPPAKHDPKS